MKKALVSVFCLLVSTVGFSSGVVLLEGAYQGKNIYIQNPYSSSGVGFCIQEVRVNGHVASDEITSSAFEIDLRNFQFKISDKVEIKIVYRDGCRPKVLNPEVLNAKSTFEIVDMSIGKDLILNWSTKGEVGPIPYAIEQFRWNKWVKIGEMEGQGTAELNEYAYKVIPHSGKNQYRIKQIDYTGFPRFSKTIEYQSPKPETTFHLAKASKKINFFEGSKSSETMFEIYDQFGNIVKRGFASSIDISTLDKGPYYLNSDNTMSEFNKK